MFVYVRFEFDGSPLLPSSPPFGFEESIQVFSVSTSLARRGPVGGLSGTIGASTVPGVEIVKRVDSATPAFSMSISDGRRFQIRAQVVEPDQSGQEVNTFDIELDDAVVAIQEINLGPPPADVGAPHARPIYWERLVFHWVRMRIIHHEPRTEMELTWGLDP